MRWVPTGAWQAPVCEPAAVPGPCMGQGAGCRDIVPGHTHRYWRGGTTKGAVPPVCATCVCLLSDVNWQAKPNGEAVTSKPWQDAAVLQACTIALR